MYIIKHCSKVYGYIHSVMKDGTTQLIILFLNNVADWICQKTNLGTDISLLEGNLEMLSAFTQVWGERWSRMGS